MSPRVKLNSLAIRGFKSFGFGTVDLTRSDQTATHTLTFNDVTLLLGANGAGKSSVVGVMQYLGANSNKRVQEFVGRHGGARSICHYGETRAARIDFDLDYHAGGVSGSYSHTLVTAEPDTLKYLGGSYGAVGLGAREEDPVAALPEPNWQPHQSRPRELAHRAVSGIRAFQFHDTSSAAGVRSSGYIEDALELRGDASNLAAFLHAMQVKDPQHYARIRSTIRQVFPAFDDFELKPTPLNERVILLNWRAVGRPEYLFGPHQVSDGTLRFMALAALLLQPHERLPAMIVIDEPELGLHPSAIATLAGLVKQASLHAQVLLATQSPTLVDHFALENVRVIQHDGSSSTFLDLDIDDLRRWLDDYSLGEIWQKNLFGGGPEHA